MLLFSALRTQRFCRLLFWSQLSVSCAVFLWLWPNCPTAGGGGQSCFYFSVQTAADKYKNKVGAEELGVCRCASALVWSAGAAGAIPQRSSPLCLLLPIVIKKVGGGGGLSYEGRDRKQPRTTESKFSVSVCALYARAEIWHAGPRLIPVLLLASSLQKSLS